MFHRQAEVKFRDNQENRVQQFPKTPKANGVQSSKFVTPAPKPRIALGAKSTNVHHRQFSSTKTGKRHSPTTAPRKQNLIVPQDQVQTLEGGAALRAALERALATGVNIPDVEYAPPPVEELPYMEPEGLEPMDWDALKYLRKMGALEQKPEPLFQRRPIDDALPQFEFIKTTLEEQESTLPSRNGTTNRKIPKLGGYAAPTLAARAKIKTSVSTLTSKHDIRESILPRPTRSMSRGASSFDSSNSKTAPRSTQAGHPQRPSKSAIKSGDPQTSASPAIVEPLDLLCEEMAVHYDIDDE